jgi:hypothetical protein
MSSIVLLGFLVSVVVKWLLGQGPLDVGFVPRAETPSNHFISTWLETAPGIGILRSTGVVRQSVTAVAVGTYSVKTRDSWDQPGTW